MKQNTMQIGEKIRIAFVFNHSFFLGGGEISFMELIRNLDRDLFKAIVIVPDEGEIAKQLRAENIPVNVLHMPPMKQFLAGSPVYQLMKLTKLLKWEKVAIIHANGSRACLYGGIAGLIVGVPLIWHVRETMQDYALYDAFLGSLARTIICVSKSV